MKLPYKALIEQLQFNRTLFQEVNIYFTETGYEKKKRENEKKEKHSAR